MRPRGIADRQAPGYRIRRIGGDARRPLDCVARDPIKESQAFLCWPTTMTASIAPSMRSPLLHPSSGPDASEIRVPRAIATPWMVWPIDRLLEQSCSTISSQSAVDAFKSMSAPVTRGLASAPLERIRANHPRRRHAMAVVMSIWQLHRVDLGKNSGYLVFRPPSPTARSLPARSGSPTRNCSHWLASIRCECRGP